MTALIVCMRFSAWSKTMRVLRLEDLVGDLHAVQPEALEDVLAHLGLAVVEGGQAVHELDRRGCRSSRSRPC